MVTEIVYTSKEKALIEALIKIKELCKPGQQLYHSQCIDVMYDCYSLTNDTIINFTNKIEII